MFSKAEQSVVDLLKTGITNKEIAERLFVCEQTVRFHATNIYKKVGAKSKSDFILKYQQRFEGKQLEDKVADYVPVSQARPEVLPAQSNQGYRSVQVPQRTQEDKINYVNQTFKVTETLTHLHNMMTEVTKKEITPATVSAACNCVARLNETVNTAIQAARFLNER